MRVLLWIACFAFVVLPSGRLLGQGETTSAIVGTVVDPSGGALAGAHVTIVSAETGSRRTATTDDAGRFSFPQLKPGTYGIKVESEGFEPQNNPAVSAGLGQKQTVSFTLKLAAAKGEVTITGEAPLVNSRNCFQKRFVRASDRCANSGVERFVPISASPPIVIGAIGGV